MKKKNWILSGFVAVLVASCFLFIGFSSHASAQKDKSTCCSQKMSAHGVLSTELRERTGPGGKNCAAKTNSSASGEIILENLSRQFLFITPLRY